MRARALFPAQRAARALFPAQGAARARRALPWILAVAGALAAALAVGAPGTDGPLLDPSSTGPSGTKALVDTLRELGARVEVRSEPPGRGDTTALLLVDDLDDPGRRQMTDWVRGGGTLIVTDVTSPLQPARPGSSISLGGLDPELRRGCPVAALSAVDRVSAPGAVLLEVPPGATGCFPGERESWLVVASVGRGTVVGLGGASAFLNSHLARADNAVLAATLLAPTPTDRVVVLRPPAPGAGQEDLGDLVAPRVKLALVQLGVAFVLVALWRAPRLGRPVLEPQPVQVPGSALVIAVGELLQRTRSRAQAASVLGDDLRRTLAARLGLPSSAPAEVVADAVAGRSTRSAEEVLAVLAGQTPADEEALVALAQTVEAIRREIGRNEVGSR